MLTKFNLYIGLHFYKSDVVETPQSLLDASNFIGIIEKRQDLKIACIEDAQMEKIINSLKDGVDYKNYLKRVYEDSHEDY